MGVFSLREIEELRHRFIRQALAAANEGEHSRFERLIRRAMELARERAMRKVKHLEGKETSEREG